MVWLIFYSSPAHIFDNKSTTSFCADVYFEYNSFIPDVTTSGTFFPSWWAMNPRIENMGNPATILVIQLPSDTMSVSLQKKID